MPTHPHLFGVRDNLNLAEKQAHRTVAFLALDDFAIVGRLRHQWSHPRVARMLDNVLQKAGARLYGTAP